MELKVLLNSVYTIVFGGEHEDLKACDCKPQAAQKQRGEIFQMPLHYPRYKKGDYEKMEEWKLDCLLREYGLCFYGSRQEKRDFAIGAFLWPDQMVDE